MAKLYSTLKIGAAVGKGALQSRHGELHAIMKNSEVLKYCVPNEFICAEIGRFLGLPVPPCGLMYIQGHVPEHWFASLNFNLTATNLPPVDPGMCVKEVEDEVTGLVLFDVLIANDDRHRDNLYLDTSQKPPRLSIFDHSHALFGAKNGEGQKRLNDQKDKLAVGTHCLLEHLSSNKFFRKWYDRINGLPKYLIDDACDSTVPLGMISAAEAEAAKVFLTHRKASIEELVKANKPEFKGIQQWDLMIP